GGGVLVGVGAARVGSPLLDVDGLDCFFSSRRRHTSSLRDWSSDVCSSDLSAFAGDLWIAAREGGAARRLTSHVGDELYPKFSPDGKWIAFTGEYDGNPDVYVISAEGGEPRRLTSHPSNDNVLRWTPEHKNNLSRSDRFSAP